LERSGRMNDCNLAEARLREGPPNLAEARLRLAT
jgi:hypothetical protein